MSEQLVTAAYNAGMVDGADAERARIIEILAKADPETCLGANFWAIEYITNHTSRHAQPNR